MSNGSIENRHTISVPITLASGNSSPRSPSSPLLRSASYAELSPNEQPQKFPARSDSLRRSFSENVLANGLANIVRRSSTNTKEEQNGSPCLERPDPRRNSTHSAKADHLVPAFCLGDDESAEDHVHALNTEEPTKKQTKESLEPLNREEPGNKKISEKEQVRRSVSTSLSKFARRKSWIGTSRSPSPSPNKRHSRVEKETVEASQESSWPSNASKPEEQPPVHDSAQAPTNGITGKNSLVGKKSRRPLSQLLSRDSFVETPSVPSIPKSYSTERLPTLKHRRSNLSEAPAVPRSTSYERLQGAGTESPRKKDELWGVFRALDGEFSKFQSRPSTTKTAVVRSSLLPFLRTYADHSSISSLRPEDLDRRTVILNKWWTGLLEMLNGRYGESVSGNDRPAVLEAATALMIRPEWTVPPPPLHVRTARGPRASLKSRSTTSLGSTMSDFLVDSVFHNVKNTFTQNLLAQMAYVVQKMSTRNVAASVVTFCGKATAYAFFYCEGVAAILVRLWTIPTDTLRRVLTEYGYSRTDRLDAVSDKVCASYPTCIHPLAFKSLRSTARYLRSRPHLPIATAYIPWHGPWVTRWAGKDTDLFFVFVKHFTDLICRFMPDGLLPGEQLVAPGWALVQAQMLTVMRSTIQRPSNAPSGNNLVEASSTTFEEMLGEADATASMLPLPVNGMARSMAENRLIMLLRDCLANSNIMTDKAQSIFADVFDRLLKATARHTSIFDHSACFTLCDLLEEAIVILTRFNRPSNFATSGFDWSFWFDVCKHMLQSQNSMTEVRLFAFLFSMWGSITKDDNRRRQICLDWLLSKDTFQVQFNHWCPMVRAFFMRLLIWKVARPSTTRSGLDQAVLHTLCQRLDEVWSNFLYVQQNAERTGLATPSTAPCSPAPSRQLLIMRDDIQAAPSGMFLSFDGILSSAGNTKANPYEKHSSQSPNGHKPPLGSGTDDYERTYGSGKKKWGLLKSIIPFSITSNATDRKGSTKPSGQIKLPSSFRPSDNSSRPSIKGDDTKIAPVVPYRSLSFKFSLEWVDKDHHPSGKQRRLYPPKLPPLAQDYLKGREPDVDHNEPRKPDDSALVPSRYAGRALAEWAILVIECQNFFERRRAEGVPSYQLVEIPSLSVEPFRKM